MTSCNVGFLETDNINVILVILPQLEFCSLVEQVKQLAAVDLVEGELGLEMLELGLTRCCFTFAR
jgi:hypothetical protein